MARQVAIVVGVSRVRGLPVLAGVSPATAAFAAWATSQDFEVVVHDDAAQRVTAQAVFESVRDAVEAGDVERLFVFFSGHGVEAGIGDDFWLLSDADTDPGAAVNVAKSVRLARRCGIAHVALFADSCRTPASQGFHGVTGRPIFPTTRVDSVRVQLDTFYATLSGDPAYEPAAAEHTFGIFTECLLRALHGMEPEVVTPVLGGQSSHAVLAFPLADYLDREVPERAAREHDVAQIPDCIPGSVWEPNVVAWVPGRGAAAEPPPQSPSTRTHRFERKLTGDGGSAVPTGERRQVAAALAKRLVAEPSRSGRYSGEQVTVRGAAVDEALVGGRPTFFLRNEIFGSSRGGDAESVLLRLQDGRWIATVALRAHRTTVTVSERGAEHVAFVPEAGGNPLRLAEAEARLRCGLRDVVDEKWFRDLLDQANPTVAVLAAYEFARRGRDDEVRRVAEGFRGPGDAVPFDVAMLAELPEDVPTVPGFPLMARGWALADRLPGGEALLDYSRPFLAPAPWTTFRTLPDEVVTALSGTG